MENDEKMTLDTYVMEVRKGEYLYLNSADDGDGAYFDLTPCIWNAYWHDLDKLKEIAAIEFSNFDAGYPKFHKYRFTYERLGTEN